MSNSQNWGIAMRFSQVAACYVMEFYDPQKKKKIVWTIMILRTARGKTRFSTCIFITESPHGGQSIGYNLKQTLII